MVINAQDFLEAIEGIELSKGISREVVLKSLEEAMRKGYKKEIGDTQDELLVVVNIVPEQGLIEMFSTKDIVDEVEDDFLQISKEDAKELAKAKQGEIREDKFYIPAPIDTLRKATALGIKSILKQKFAEAEKSVLYELFKDKINTMITGKVEKVDEKGCSVNIGRTSVYLPRKQMIGDEKFAVGDSIRLFVENVDSNTKGARINVSRSSEGFLRSLFNEEIREIEDGVIVIKGIAREAGERSKVAVYTNDPNVDPAGACIGQNGNRIQKIVSQLGNGQSKEKIDIIAYSDIPGLYIMEALKPARVVGVNFDAEKKSAVVVVNDDSLSLAIGRRGVNARLAVRLTGYNIDIKTETEAIEEGFEYQSLEELQSLEAENLAKRIEEERKASVTLHAGEVLPGMPEGYVAPQARVYEDEANDFDEALRETAEKEEISAPVNEIKEEVKREAPVVEEAPVKEEQPKVEEVKEVKVKTTTTLSDLEKTLESETNKSSKKSSSKKSNKKKAEEVEESVLPTKQDPSTYMSIYSEEELKEMEEEEKNLEDEYDDDVDYDEYDDYYDDDDR